MTRLPHTRPAARDARPPMSILRDLPQPTQSQLRSELWRMNRRSWRFWAAVMLLAALPPAGAWLGHRFDPHRPGHPSPAAAAVTLGTAAAALALFTRLVSPIVNRNLRTILTNHQLCTSCGYDLRATPGRCPECGTIPAR